MVSCTLQLVCYLKKIPILEGANCMPGFDSPSCFYNIFSDGIIFTRISNVCVFPGFHL